MEYKTWLSNVIGLNAFYLFMTVINFLVVGWILNGYGASKVVWLGTLVAIAYVIRVGSGGTAVASVWLVVTMSLLAVRHVWFRGIPRPEFHYIPLAVLATWCFCLWVVWLLGKYSDYLVRDIESPKAKGLFLILFCAIVAGLTLGSRLYQETLYLFFGV